MGTAIAVLCLLGVPAPVNSAAETTPDSSTAAGELPSNIFPTSPLAQVVRLTQAGVDESVILTYVSNSSSTFNLDSDKIIYLRDIGLSKEVLTAMIQHDQQLQQQMTTTSSQPAPVTETVPQTEPATTTVVESEAAPAEVTVDYFHDTLAPYGTWVDVDGYGRCWRPVVVVNNPDWQPYCDNGHWVYTDCGWYWYSDYSWGWAPFHYGRWYQHPHLGWVWTPDTVWGPSWVTWRYSEGYCGWAPLPPFATYQTGVGFFYRGGAVSVDFNWGLNIGCFTFVPTEFFCDRHPRNHRMGPDERGRIFDRSRPLNNFDGHGHNLANRGIDPGRISAVTHNPIHPVNIRNVPGSAGNGPRGDQISRDGRTLTIGRPGQQHGTPAQTHPTQGHQEQGHSTQQNAYRPAQQNAYQPGTSIHSGQQSQTPGNTHSPQAGSAVQNPAQHSSASYNSPSSASGRNSSTLSPRGLEQSKSSPSSHGNTHSSDAWPGASSYNQGQSGTSGAGRNSTSTAAPSQSQHSQPASSPPQSSSPRSSGQNQNSSGNGSGHNSGNGSDRGPGH